MMELLSDPQVWVSFGTLAAMEIVLGIDNIVFITILCGRLPEDQQPAARRIGIGVALISRLALLGAIGWVLTLKQPLFEIPIVAHTMSGKELILLLGGLFLVGKATTEIYENVERPEVDHLHEGGREKADETTEGPEPTEQALAHQYM
ncbi:MAG: TerC family protein, partial [Bradymonadaceae bacterium]